MNVDDALALLHGSTLAIPLAAGIAVATLAVVIPVGVCVCVCFNCCYY